MIGKIKCLFGFHVYKVLRPLMIGGELIECVRCGTKLCIHHGRQRVIPYDEDIQLLERQITKLMESP
jgi:hypothetical protein